ncbi:MAG: DUF389 domain-containing protein [Candidatus Sericytochromatia bacterium]
MKDSSFKNIYEYFFYLFDIKHDKDEQGAIDNIKKSIEFRGENLWTLICAIFIASIGLNTNSTAVIIGAMLISPLMGPIVGTGLAIGINDFQLLKTSLKNLSISVIASLITSTVYFSLTPLTEVQSELLARTNPTIFDVLIALLGGVAGIVANTRKEKSNVIPGVAIATALMPPLCTAGYGLATNNYLFFLGAFYLFFINSVFICIATIFVIQFLGFNEVEYIDIKKQSKIKKYIFLFAFLTILPSIYTAWNVVNESIFKSRAIHFINEKTKFKNTKLINSKFNYNKNGISTIDLTFIGENIPNNNISELKNSLSNYNLRNTELFINQSNTSSINIEEEFNKMNQTLKVELTEELYKNNLESLRKSEEKIAILEKSLENNKNKVKELLSINEKVDLDKIMKEIKTFYPNIKEISFSKATKKDTKSNKLIEYPLFIIKWNKNSDIYDKNKILNFLKIRTAKNNLELLNI